MSSTLATPLEAPTAHPPGWRAWLLATRPATLPAAVLPVVVGTALAARAGAARWSVTLTTLVATLLIQIGTNLFNDYADFVKGADTHERLGPKRATQQGWLAPHTVLRASLATFTGALAAGAWLVHLAGWPVVVIGLASIACGLLYTGSRYALAYTGLGDLFVFVFFGLVAVVGTYYVHTGSIAAIAWWAAVPVGLLITAILVVNNLRDRHTDARAHKRTLAVRFGGAFARAQYALLVVSAYLCVVLAVTSGEAPRGWLLALASAPWAFLSIRAVRRLDGVALNPWLGATARLGLVFGILLAAGSLL